MGATDFIAPTSSSQSGSVGFFCAGATPDICPRSICAALAGYELGLLEFAVIAVLASQTFRVGNGQPVDFRTALSMLKSHSLVLLGVWGAWLIIRWLLLFLLFDLPFVRLPVADFFSSLGINYTLVLMIPFVEGFICVNALWSLVSVLFGGFALKRALVYGLIGVWKSRTLAIQGLWFIGIFAATHVLLLLGHDSIRGSPTPNILAAVDLSRRLLEAVLITFLTVALTLAYNGEQKRQRSGAA